MDFTNSYGVRLLMPFSERWFYGDALYIVDPWLYSLLGVGWWLARSTRRVRRASAWRWRRSTWLAMLLSNVIARREVASGLARAGAGRDAFHGHAGRRESVSARSRDRRRRSLRERQSLVRSAAAFPSRRIRHRRKGSTSRTRSRRCSRPRPRAFLRWSRFPFVQVDPRGRRSGSTTIATRTPAPMAGPARQARSKAITSSLQALKPVR